MPFIFVFLFSMFFLFTLNYESCRATKKQTQNQGKDKDGNRKILKLSAKLFRISSFPFLRLSTLCKGLDLAIWITYFNYLGSESVNTQKMFWRREIGNRVSNWTTTSIYALSANTPQWLPKLTRVINLCFPLFLCQTYFKKGFPMLKA